MASVKKRVAISSLCSCLAAPAIAVPTQKKVLNSSPGRLAVYEPFLRVPLCYETASSCDTGDTLIAGVGHSEQNSPNTVDGCNDQSASVYQRDESLDRIVVKSKDGGAMIAGTTLEIHATVSMAVDVSSRSNPGHSETAHMYYHSESTGAWEYICSKLSLPEVGTVTFSCDFEIPADNYYTSCGSTCGLQAVRVNYGYGEYAVESCTQNGIWDAQYSDVDDLVFLVVPAPTARPRLYITSSMPSNVPNPSMHASSINPTTSADVSDFLFVCATSFIDALTHCTNNPLCLTGTECEGGSSCYLIHCTDCPEIDCYTPTSSPLKETNLSSSEPPHSHTPNPSLSPPAPRTIVPSQIQSQTPVSEFLFICADDYFNALTRCTDNPLCPTGIECVGDHECLPIPCTACPETPCCPTALSSSNQTSNPEIPCSSIAPASNPAEQTPNAKPPTKRPNVHTGSPAAIPTVLPTKKGGKSSKRRFSFPPSGLAAEIIAIHDADMLAPRCSTFGSSCSSGDLLTGVGTLGPEPNAPNTIDVCEGEGRNLTSSVHHDESVDQIIVRATNGEVIAFNVEVEVEITLSSATDTSKRTIPNKWSVAHAYFAPRAFVGEAGTRWEFLESFVVEPGSGENVFSVRFVFPADDSVPKEEDLNETFQNNSPHVSAIRTSYRYAGYSRSPCASDGVDDPSYMDVDDLLFRVASVDPSKIVGPTVAPSQMIEEDSITRPTTSAYFDRQNDIWIGAIAIVATQLLLWV